MDEREGILLSINALEAQRAALGDAVVDLAIQALRARLDTLTAAQQSSLEQRKLVTLLFADLSGFTTLSETLDAEEVNEFINSLWQRLDRIVVEHGGEIEKHIGDAVEALWGVKNTREDDAEQAIRAALAIQKELREVRFEFRAHGSQHAARQYQAAMRIGVHTGTALFGKISTTGEYAAMGDVVSIAEQLQRAASVGGILISHDTYRHVRGLFTVSKVETIAIKDRAAPMQAYTIEAARPRAFRLGGRGVEGIETRLIGRDAEFEQLQAAFHAATQRKELRMLSIIGEAGTGKSRLLYEFDNWLEILPEEIGYFKGRARPEMRHIPHALIRDLFAFRFQIQDSDRASIMRAKMERGVAESLGNGSQSQEKAHFIGQLLGFDFSDSPHLQGVLHDAKQLHDRAIIYLGDYFQAAAARRPIVVLLEDLHWADESSLELLTLLCRMLPDQPLLVVCTSRPELFERLPDWGKKQAFHARLELPPLSREHTASLVRELLQKVEPLPDALHELIVGKAEGNPYYVEELIKMLVEDGVIITGEERWLVDASRLSAVRVPPTLTGILQARLDTLSSIERPTMQRASVIGRVFWDEGVSALSAEAERAGNMPALHATLAGLSHKELVFQRKASSFSGAHEYIFKHAILRDVVYESVLKRDKRLYHARAAEWLIQRGGERVGEYAGLIAGHFEQAGHYEQAVDWLLRTGEAAYRTSAHREAIAAFERALALTPRITTAESPHRRAGLLVRLGQAHTRLSDFGDARQYLDEGLALARQAGDRKSITYALVDLSRVVREQGDYDTAQGYAEEALASARQSGERGLEAAALERMGSIALYRGDFSVAIPYYIDSLALQREVNDRQGIASCLNGLGVIGILQSNHSQAGRQLEDSLAIYREVGDRAGAASCLVNMGWEDNLLGNHARGAQRLQESLELFRQIGEIDGIAVSHIYLGHALVGLGETQAAEGHYLAAISEALSINGLPRILDALAGLAELRCKAGEHIRAGEMIGLALGHPATFSDVSAAAEPVLASLRAVLTEETLNSALERGKGLDLQAVLRELLGQETG